MEPVVQYPVNHEFRTAIMWFRRDLRVDDNPALVAALNASASVIPVFIWAPEEEGQFQPGRCSRWWTKHSLVDLQQALAALGSRMIIRRSTDSTAALLQVVKEVGAEAVFFNHLYDPISLMRDHDCKRGLTAAGVAHRTFNGDMLYEPWDVLDANKQPYSTFDDFWNAVRNMSVPPPFPMPAPELMPPVPASVSSLTVTEVDWFFTAEQEASSDQLKFKWKPGVGGAITELERFVGERLHVFEHDRAKMDRDSTSRLSPWIHIGSISVRYIFYRVRQCQAEWLAAGADRSRSCDDFLQQVGYREYSRYLAFHFPFIHERSLLRHLRACPWRIEQHAFKAWRQGQTGYPLIDAAMRQLWSSGWCHNRARVVAASFLVKDLLLPWQWGLKHYWDAQIDADLECDALGWQYVSGGMSDAHPFSYMMDLEVEARRFDPDGEYVRRWLPVLSRLPTEYIHTPWKAPPQVLAAADVDLGCNYPAPIISRHDAKANVDYACSILDKCVVAQSSESSGRYPYRAQTYPVAMGAGAAGASSGANPTGNATGGGAPSQMNMQAQTYGGGTSAGEGATGRVAGGAGQGPQPGSRSVSAANGGAGGGGGGGVSSFGGGGAGGAVPYQAGMMSTAAVAEAVRAQAGAGSMAPPPPQPHSGAFAAGVSGRDGGGSSGKRSADAAAAAPAGPQAGGGMVYYHPGDSAGQQALERILQQQRRTRGAARRQDGSGTNDRTAAPGSQQAGAAAAQAPPFAAAPFGMDLGMFGGVGMPPGPAAAAWAERVGMGEADEGALALWQQQQMLQGGTAAFAFEQAMQMLLARRRMGDGVSNISGGGEDEEGPGGLGLEDEDSEEVVSNTVNLNVTAATGASWYQAGTARGARQRGRAAAEQEDEETPGGSPIKSAGDEADPFATGGHHRDNHDAERPVGQHHHHHHGHHHHAARRVRLDVDRRQGGDCGDEAMEEHEAGGDSRGAAATLHTQQGGGCARTTSGAAPRGAPEADEGEAECRERAQGSREEEEEGDRMVESSDSEEEASGRGMQQSQEQQYQEHNSGGPRHTSGATTGRRSDGAGAPGGGGGGVSAPADAEEMAVCPRGNNHPPQGDQQAGAAAVHKRRRSGSVDWE